MNVQYLANFFEFDPDLLYTSVFSFSCVSRSLTSACHNLFFVYSQGKFWPFSQNDTHTHTPPLSFLHFLSVRMILYFCISGIKPTFKISPDPVAVSPCSAASKSDKKVDISRNICSLDLVTKISSIMTWPTRSPFKRQSDGEQGDLRCTRYWSTHLPAMLTSSQVKCWQRITSN